MKKNNYQVLLTIAILSLTTAILFIYLSVFRTLGTSQKPILTVQETRPLDPKLDEELLKKLQERTR